MDISLIARISELAARQRLWQWGAIALMVGLIYTLTRLSPLLINIFIRKPASSIPLLAGDDDEDCFTSDDEDEAESDESSCSSEDDPLSISYDNLAGFCDEFVWESKSARKRKVKMRRKRSVGGNMFSFGDLLNGQSVVKIWDPNSSVFISASSSSVNTWDLRVRRRTTPDKVVMLSGPEKVYVTWKGEIWDIRNTKAPLETGTECHADNCSNANGVTQTS